MAAELALSKSGYLTKQGHRVKNWKRRYFTVENGLLTYFETAGDTKNLGQINIANCAIEIEPEDRFKRANVFVITAATGESLILQADGETDLNAWVAFLQRVAASCIYLAGPLCQLAGWRKRWRPRYFVLSGPRLAWYDSEANALAPGGVSKPLGTLALLKSVEIEPVDGERGAAILASGHEPASGAGGTSRGLGSPLRKSFGVGRNKDKDKAEAAADGADGDGDGDGAAATGAAAAAPADDGATHVILLTGADGKVALTLAAGNDGDRHAWVTLMRCAADPERYPLPPRPPILVSRPAPARAGSNASLGSGASTPLVSGGSSDAGSGGASNPFASPAPAPKDAPPAPSSLPAGFGVMAPISEAPADDDDGAGSVGDDTAAAAAAAAAPAEANPFLAPTPPPPAADEAVESEEELRARIRAEELERIRAEEAAKVERIRAEEAARAERHRAEEAAKAERARAEEAARAARAREEEAARAAAEADARAAAARAEEEARAAAAARAAEIDRIRAEERERIRREERERLMRELGLSPSADVATLAATAAAPGSPSGAGSSGGAALSPSQLVPPAAPVPVLPPEQLRSLSPAARQLAERLAVAEAELARERAVSALRSKQYEMNSSYATAATARAARERDESRMRQREIEVELERERAIAKQAALELELERRRSKLNYTVNVVKTVEVERQVAAAAAGGDAPTGDAAAAPASHRPPLGRPPSAYAMHLAAQQQQQQSAAAAAAAAAGGRTSRRASLHGQQQQPPGGDAAAHEAAALAEEQQHQEEEAVSPAAASDFEAPPAAAAEPAAAEPPAVEAEQPPAAPAEPQVWTCGPTEGERATMRKRISEYLLRRTPSAASSPAQAAFLTDVVVPSVEESLYRDAAGSLAAYTDPATLKARLKKVFSERAAGAAAPPPPPSAAPAPAPTPAAAAPASGNPFAAASEAASPPTPAQAGRASDVTSPAATGSGLDAVTPAASTPAGAATGGNAADTGSGSGGVDTAERSKGRMLDSFRAVMESPPFSTLAPNTPASVAGGEGGDAPGSAPPSAVSAAASPADDAAGATPAPRLARRRPLQDSTGPAGRLDVMSPAERRRAAAAAAAAHNRAAQQKGRKPQPRRGRGGSDDDDDDEEEEEEGGDDGEGEGEDGDTVGDDEEDGSDDDDAASGGKPASGSGSGKAGGGGRRATVGSTSRSSALPRRWGKRPHPFTVMTPPVPIRHYPALADGSVHISLVLERRPGEHPYLPDLNKWQHRQCAQCGRGQTTGLGLFSSDAKAHYCWYTELLYCRECMDASPRPIPWRVLHELDDKPRPVSKPAAAFIDPVLGAPIVNVPALAPAAMARSKGMQQLQALRTRAVEALGGIAAAAGDAAAADAKRVAGSSLGKGLAWLLDSPDLFPLAQIAELAAEPGPALKRLRMARAALRQFADQRGIALPAAAAEGAAGGATDGDGEG